MKAKMMHKKYCSSHINLATSLPVRALGIHCRVSGIAPGPIWKVGEKKKYLFHPELGIPNLLARSELLKSLRHPSSRMFQHARNKESIRHPN
jgi:hypothetical protein